MRRSVLPVLFAFVLVAGLLAQNTAGAAPPTPGKDRLDVYVADMTGSQVSDLIALGVDRQDLELSVTPDEQGGKAQVRVEAILSGAQADRLRSRGIDVRLKRVDGQTAAQRATLQAAAGYEVFRTYAGKGGLKEEFEEVAADNPRITKLVRYGQTINGQDIVALKVSKNAKRMKDGKKPAVLYLGAQHAREWITPEMIRRLMNLVVDGYGSDRKITKLVDQNELWFVPVANPDGYDWTFEPDQRLWRKNLRDNNGDGTIAPGDGVDLNRNFATKWGYDNEGSSPNPASETYRGPGPNSEPETEALDALVDRVGFEFFVNYHSAAQLLLYGTGWQVATPTPDDVIYEAMAGDDENPAVEGYDPDISAELYTTNGDTDTHMTELFGTLGFTPEMSTCEAASDSVPDDEWVAEDCGSGFEFPDDEELVQAEFEKNIPFALSVAKSAKDPDDPVSSVGRTAEDFRVDTFDVSYGDPQTVAVWAKRALKNLRMNYRIDGGRQQWTRAPEWAGGERYGDENDDYYAEFRGRVRGADVGDEVEVWFTGVKPGKGPVRSERFSYTVESDSGDDVLVIANEDYTGANPEYPDGTDAPKYADAHVAAVEEAGYSTDVWDVDSQGVPHDLGVLDHYDAVLWYLGDNRITMDPEDVLTTTPFGDLPDLSVAERQQYLTMAVRDYLNAGGKLVHAGETAQYQGLLGISDAVGGLYYGLNGAPEEECEILPQVNSPTAGFFEDCLILADDFRQYYLGAFTRTDTVEPTAVEGVAEPITGYTGSLGGNPDNPLDEAGTFQPTSDVLPVDEFPQFASEGSALYPFEAGSPFAPIEGERYAGALHVDSSYQRLTRTFDVPAGASSAELQFQLSANIEPGYDFVIVEARTPGDSNWTTLPEVGGLTSTDSPTECADASSFLLALHPFLTTYLGTDCQGTGAGGDWNAILEGTDGWTDVGYDLSGFAGQQVEVSISYVTDPSTGGVGAFVDDTRLVVDGGATEADGFEGATSEWTPGGPPDGSPPNAGNWQIGENLVQAFGATSTEDTLLLGFGLEQLTTDAERADLVERALDGLLG
jgi:hypothetical protein